MDWGIATGILGIVVALFIYKFQRIKKYPSRLSYSILYSSLVMQRLPTHFERLELNYNCKSIEQNLLYIRFIIYNKHASDVCAMDPDNAITISLSKGSKWVDIRVSKESDEINGSISINDNNSSDAQLVVPVLKKDEFLIIDGLIETADHGSAFDSNCFSFHHRIPNLDSFEYVQYISDSIYKRTKKNVWRASIWAGLLIGLFVLQLFLPHYSSIEYQREGDEALFKASIDKDTNIVINGEQVFKHDSIISVEEFEAQYRPSYQYRQSSALDIYNCIIYCICAVVFVFFFSSEIKDIVRYKQLKRYLSS